MSRGVYWNQAQKIFIHPYTEYPWVSVTLWLCGHFTWFCDKKQAKVKILHIDWSVFFVSIFWTTALKRGSSWRGLQSTHRICWICSYKLAPGGVWTPISRTASQRATNWATLACVLFQKACLLSDSCRYCNNKWIAKYIFDEGICWQISQAMFFQLRHYLVEIFLKTFLKICREHFFDTGINLSD